MLDYLAILILGFVIGIVMGFISKSDEYKKLLVKSE